jgi:hypothetical protein
MRLNVVALLVEVDIMLVENYPELNVSIESSAPLLDFGHLHAMIALPWRSACYRA